MLAHLRIAYDAASPVYAAGRRTLAELAGVSDPTATRATHRLIDAGLLQQHRPATAQLAAEYGIPEPNKRPRERRKCA